jgi:microcystin-dependent protein
MVGFSYAPRGWEFCDGRLIRVEENPTLYALLGTTYGGDGYNTFALPDLRGRVPIHVGSGAGPGLSNYARGQKGGTETVTLTTQHMPSHNHSANLHVNSGSGNTDNPNGNYIASNSEGIKHYSNTADSIANSGNISVTTNGSDNPHTNIQPYLGINYVIATDGLFPPRP